MLVLTGYVVYQHFMAPTRILIVNALKLQQANITLNNDSRYIDVECVETDDMTSLDGYDAVIIFARHIFLSDEQRAEVKRAADNGVPIFTRTQKANDFVENHNLTDEQVDTLRQYFDNENRHNYRNGLRYLRHIASPGRWGDQTYEEPVEIPTDMYYHREYGQYFKTAEALTAYLKKKGLYHAGGHRVALIGGLSFPMEGNREHVDTLITMLTRRGINVFPMVSTGKSLRRMLQDMKPDAVVRMPVGRMGNDTLAMWLYEKNIPLFCPYPLAMTHSEWMDEQQPMPSGSKNARVTLPEIDGGRAPFCIGTQNPNSQGYYIHSAETERCETFADHLEKCLLLRTKANKDKRIAIGYFRRPGTDALLASGMEVIPSVYNLLRRLQAEGYNVSGLPATLEAFSREIRREGMVLGTYAKGAQARYLDEGHPLWIARSQYEQWAREVIPAGKYAEVEQRYGKAPGALLARGDSIAVACLRYGNILIFPQPRPALGDDDFKLVHGAKVAPPHSYLAPYLYVQRGFQADALIHFGTHGNLEFTPGRDAGMRAEDWSQQLVGATPHFYFYTTGNIGEAVIAKRRTNATLVTYLTPPYAESGMQQKYDALHSDIHKALHTDRQSPTLRQRIVKEGLHRLLGIDSTLTTPLTQDELERTDCHIEELMNEKMQGAYYTLGQPYNDSELQQTVKAMSDDPATWPQLRQLLLTSTRAELDQMVRALQGGSIAPAPGGDPILNENVLPTGRNMYSINPENTPDPEAWEDGKRLAESTLAQYRKQHGCYPRQVSYTFWAGEFITTGGATIAQALWMLGVEPERDTQGRIGPLRLVPAQELGRPRINVMVQVSGQLRDIADSRLRLITEAVKMASAAEGDSNYVHEATLQQEKELIEKGIAPKQARELSALRVFGPVNGGYSTGMMDYIERSGKWNGTDELAGGYLNNMCAAYGDTAHWGMSQKELFTAALRHTDMLVQPRQSNTWGPVSLDHVYEFSGGLSMTVKSLSGKEPDAMMADYRNRRNRRMQGMKEAIDVEMRTTVLNPQFVRERMKGGEGTAQMFGEVFRNIFGWNVTRPSALDTQLYDDLYRMYVKDEQQLGIRRYFEQQNPAAYQAMTSVMLESARKGYWKPTESQLQQTARLHAAITSKSGAACTDFVCNNPQLQTFVSRQLSGSEAKEYNRQLSLVKSQDGGKAQVLKKSTLTPQEEVGRGLTSLIVLGIVLLLFVAAVVWLRRKGQGAE